MLGDFDINKCLFQQINCWPFKLCVLAPEPRSDALNVALGPRMPEHF